MKQLGDKYRKEKQRLSLTDRLRSINPREIGKNILRYGIPSVGLGFLLGYANSSFGQEKDMLTIPKEDSRYETIKTLGEEVIKGYNKKLGSEMPIFYYKDFNDTLCFVVRDGNNDGVFNEGDELSRKKSDYSTFFNTPYTITPKGIRIGFSTKHGMVYDVVLRSFVHPILFDDFDMQMKILERKIYEDACEEIDSYKQFSR